MCQRLKILIKHSGLSQRRLAEMVNTSPTALCLLVNKGLVPRKGWPVLRAALQEQLVGHGCQPDAVQEALPALDEAGASDVQCKQNIEQNSPSTEVENIMIIRKQSLSPETRQHFKLIGNPFQDPQCPEDLYLTPKARYVREAMYDAAVNGNFLAVVGESGSGKSTLREELCDRLRADGKPVIIIEPSTLGMGENIADGRVLKAAHIIEAIIHAISPKAKIMISPERKAQQLKSLLVESSRAGNRHCLILEEAHDLNAHTLKNLKRFWEEKDGQKRLLSIILIAQTEFNNKLSLVDPGVREVTQRCDVVNLPPLDSVGEYLQHRFARVRVELDSIFTPEALPALQKRLFVAQDRSGRGVNMSYPLAISNLAMAAMNWAAKLGERVVTADVVEQVQP